MVEKRALAFFALASVFFGGVFVAAKAGQAYFPPLLFVALRFDVAAAVLLGYAAVTTAREDLLPRTRGDVAGILATGVLAIGLANGLLFVGQQYVSSAVGSIIFSLSPIFTPLLAAFLLSDERLSRRGTVGVLVGLLGVAFVVGVNPENLLGGGVVGKAIILGSAASAALGSVLIHRADGTLSSTVRTAWALPVSALMVHGMSLGAGESLSAVSWTPAAFAALVYVSVFAGAVAYIAYFGLLDQVGAIRASLVFYVSPVVATLGGWALLGESISLSTVAGFGVIFAGFAILGSEDSEGWLPEFVARLPTGGSSKVLTDGGRDTECRTGCDAD
ncbi:DMT family transporter [Haloprofundus salilacus]|uniref:DMT family transporter n=1 Tax=Haloprofundus salilacus TaxID=2876190 RepID=UPI001CCE2137|nr:EamA family transporter [Haloprofundus salilacus]